MYIYAHYKEYRGNAKEAREWKTNATRTKQRRGVTTEGLTAVDVDDTNRNNPKGIGKNGSAK